MKIQKLLFWIIVLSFITSCEVIDGQIKNPVQLESSPSQAASEPVLPSSLSPEQEKQLAKKYSNQADEYYKKGEYEQALLFTQKAYDMKNKALGKKQPKSLSPEQEKQLTLYMSQALKYHQKRDFKQALPFYEKSYRIIKELGAKDFVTVALLGGLAKIYQELGRLSEALSFSKKAYLLSQEVSGAQHPDTLKNLNNLALSYKNVGRFSEALSFSKKAYLLSQKVLGPKHPNTLASLNILALTYKAVGRFSEALPLFEKNYLLSQEVFGAKHHKILPSLLNLASIYEDVGRIEDALPKFEKAYSLSQEVLPAKHPLTFYSINNLATIYKNVGRLSEALPLFEKGYRLRKEVLGAKHPATLTSLNNLAVTYNSLGRSSEALPLYEKSYILSQEVLGAKHPKTLSRLSNLALFYQEQGQIQKAIKHFEKLVKGIENLRSSDLSAENRQALFKKWVVNYVVISYLYIKQSRFKDAFRLAELSKARTLLESLATKRAAQESGLSQTEQDKLQAYETRLAFFNDKIGKALKDNRLNDKFSLEMDKNQLIGELKRFEQYLKTKYPKYGELSEVQILSAKNGAKHLSKNAVLISYLVESNLVLAFTLESNGKLTAHYLGHIPNLAKDLESYRSRMLRDKTRGPFDMRKDKKDTKKLSIELGKRLLEPLKDIIKDKSHWIISPSGGLALIPFETLRLEGEKQPVIAQHKVSYVQSLSILAMLQKRDLAYKQIKNRGNLFAMGAPIYQKAKKATKRNKQPSKVDIKIARGMVQNNDYTRALRQLHPDDYWPNLPGTLKELSALKKVFRNARVYKQKQSTEAKLQSLNKQGVLKNYRYLVFSAHGYLNSDVPALSSLVLGQVDNPKGVDGYVTAGEWPSYDLKSDLMVLSACETGLGEVVGGEGVMGLPYALFVAGNKNTLLTLWSISDEITTEFITSFFRKLKGGQGQIEALTATKREFLKKGGKYAKEYYWAAFVLYGV